jgi:hypothetical protein
MERRRGTGGLGVAFVLVGILCLASGCAGLIDGTERGTYDVPESVTTAATTATTANDGTNARPGSTNASVEEPRYFDLRPTCERPPSLVVAIQVGALRNDGPDDRGLRTTYRFASPGNRAAVGPFRAFVDLIEGQYSPLLDAESASFDRFERENDTATTYVTVTGSDGEETTYRWLLERQSTGEFDGCWMTVGVGEVSDPGAGE